jgi:ABC-type phosphate transport system substrate-binding protein
MKRKKIIILLALFSLGVSTLCFSESYAVIVHPANTNQIITAKDLKAIFLGEKTNWPEGKQIKVALLKSGESHKEFLGDIVKMTPLKFSIYWKRKIFTGTGAGTHINIFKSDAEVLSYIASNPTAIGYISFSSLDDTVKAVKITK